jgi:thymidylate kinase
MAERGKFIVLYGANNLGKSTQVELLVNNLRTLQHWKLTHKVKYPIYDLEPTGPWINDILRNGSQISDSKLQALFAQNRYDFEPKLTYILELGMNIVAEDYMGTGIAWGMAKGVPLSDLEEMNKDLLKPDLSILLDGQRFSTGIERGHRHESDTESWQKAREAHLFLAGRYDWHIVPANNLEMKVSKDIWDIVKKAI